MKSETVRRDDIEDVLAHMFNVIDMRTFGSIGDVFVDDAVFTMCVTRQNRARGKFDVDLSGRNSIVEYLTAVYTGLEQTHHTLSNLTSKVLADVVRISVHIRAYHQGKGSKSHLFEESLAVADVDMRIVDGSLKVGRFDYTILIVLGSMDVFSS